MNLKEKELLLQGLQGKASAWRKLALGMGNVKECQVDGELCRAFLNKAIELGDEESYFLYHERFTEDKVGEDRKSYQDMVTEYLKTDNPQEKKALRRYLMLLKQDEEPLAAAKEEKYV